MRVLLVAPTQKDLPLVQAEIQDVLRSGLDVTPLIGDVSASDLIREIRDDDYDVLWLATHGVKDTTVTGLVRYSIRLTDGDMSSDELVANVRGKFKLVYLNTCTSFKIAQQIQEEANVTVVGTLVDIQDKLAYQTGSLFASALADGLTPAQAYKRSKPGGERIYMYLAALEPAQDSIDALVAEIKDLREQLVKSNKRLWWLIAGIGAALTLSVFNLAWLLMQGG